MEEFILKGYLKNRKRSAKEEALNSLLERTSNGKYCVEDLQLFFDTTLKPLDFFRKNEKDFTFSKNEHKEFLALFLEVWNATPRTEFKGKTPAQTFEENKQNDEIGDMIDAIAENITDDIFNDVWSEHKNDLRELSKKDLAERMFFSGVGQAFSFLEHMDTPKEIFEYIKFFSGNPSEEEAQEFLKNKK